MATPAEGVLPVFCTRKKTVLVSPSFASTLLTSGMNFQGRPGATFVSKWTTMLSSVRAAEAESAGPCRGVPS